MKINGKSIAMYGFAGFGQNIIYAMMITYLINYYTFKLGAIAGVIMFVTRVLDALKDPFVGNFVDSHRSKYGKLRHYYLLLPLPMALFTILLFSIPEIGSVGKPIYALIVFFLWGCFYTLSDITYLGSSSAMTADCGERNKLISTSRLMCTLGGALPTIIVPILLTSLGGLSDPQKYMISAIVFGIVGAALFLFGFPAAKEQIAPSVNKASIKDIFRIVKTNKPLTLILLATTLGSIRTLVQAMGIIVAKVNFGSESYFIYMALAFGGGLALGTVVVPMLTKKLSMKKLFIYSSIVGLVLQIIFCFVGYKSLAGVLVMLFLTGLPFGMYNTLAFSIPVDCIDYQEYISGLRNEGICFALQTFFGKVASGLVLLIGALAIASVGYIEGGGVHR